MSASKAFFDTNVLLYLLSGNEDKANKSEDLIASGGIISAQVLNEFAAVAKRKFRMSWLEIRDALSPIRAVCHVESVTVITHDRALQICER